MLTLKQLEELLRLNEVLLKQAQRDANLQRIFELLIHRAIVKDSLIEAYRSAHDKKAA